ncbi:MAG TPA: hypothetical protein VEI97_19610 [bacterium]|nr:hypothetical protein [bacterium]
MTVVQCRRTGQFYLGTGPEKNCEGCPRQVRKAAAAGGCEFCEAAGTGEGMVAEGGLYACAFVAAECVVVVSRGAPLLAVRVGETEAPEPDLMPVADGLFMVFVRPWPRPWLCQEGLRGGLRRREDPRAPPGRSRTVLYGALLI